MKATKRRKLKLNLLSVALLSVGLLSLLSLVSLFALHYNKGSNGSFGFNPWYQLGYVFLGVGVMIGISRAHPSLIRASSVPLYIASVLLLIGLIIVGTPIKGSVRWFDLGPIQLQPAEIAKLGLILLLARLLSSRAQHIRAATVAISVLYAAIPACLIAFQPDLGSSVVVLAVWFGMISVTPLPRRVLVAIVAMSIILVATSLPFLADYQRERVTTFLSPETDPRGAGYNARQAMITVGSGQLFGRGLDSGSQSQLNFLPSKHTDFIFAVISEKLGFIGAACLLIANVGLVMSTLGIARSMQGLFSSYILAGIATLFGFQAIVNIGMNIGLVPVTGIPLPFVSYGGTHTVIGFAMMGLVWAMYKDSGQLAFRD